MTNLFLILNIIIQHLDSAFLTKKKRKYLIIKFSFFRNEELFHGHDHIFPYLIIGKNNQYKLVKFLFETIAVNVVVYIIIDNKRKSF